MEIKVETVELDMNTDSLQNIIEAPADTNIIPLFAVFRNATPGNFDTGNTLSMKLYDSANNLLANQVLNDGSDPACHFNCFIKLGRAIPAGDKVKVKTNESYGQDQTCFVDLFYYEVD